MNLGLVEAGMGCGFLWKCDVDESVDGGKRELGGDEDSGMVERWD